MPEIKIDREEAGSIGRRIAGNNGEAEITYTTKYHKQPDWADVMTDAAPEW
jgi:hypothetical protein